MPPFPCRDDWGGRDDSAIEDWIVSVGDDERLSRKEISDLWVAVGATRDTDADWYAMCQEIGADVSIGVRVNELCGWLDDRRESLAKNRAWQDARLTFDAIYALKELTNLEWVEDGVLSRVYETPIQTTTDGRGNSTRYKRLRITLPLSIPLSKGAVWLEYEQAQNDSRKGILTRGAVATLASAIQGKKILFKYARQGSRYEGIWRVDSVDRTHAAISRDQPTRHDEQIVSQGRRYSATWSPASTTLELPGFGFRLNGTGKPRNAIDYLLDAVANYAAREVDLHRHRARSNQRVLARQAKRNLCAKKILGHRIHAGCLQYQVVWSGHNDGKPHYVPQACLLSAQELVTDYWQRLKSDQSQQLHVPKRRRLEKEFAAS